LSGKYDKTRPPPSGTRLGEKKERFARFDNERGWRTLEAVQAVAQELGATPAAVSLAWLLHQPQVTSAIFGARNVEQLESNVKATELSLSPAQLTRLEEASALELGYPYAFMKGIQGRW
jgi:aryl-alcohol dehydrogenase-like predicted oxidoreductase